MVFSFFSGSEFLDLGFEYEGFIPVLVNEVHPAFLAAYKHSRAKLGISAPRLGYLSKSIETLQHPTADAQLRHQIQQIRALGGPVGFIGGPPCPDFSNAGKHGGKDGPHGRLTQVYIDLIRTHQPDFFIFENVKGLMSNHAHHLHELENQLKDADYCFTTRLVNSLEYGVPQDRERVIIVGFHTSLYFPSSLPCPRLLRLNDDFWQAEQVYDVQAVKALAWPTFEAFQAGRESACPPGLLPELTIAHWFEKNRVEQHPNASKRFKPRAGLPRVGRRRQCLPRLRRRPRPARQDGGRREAGSPSAR